MAVAPPSSCSARGFIFIGWPRDLSSCPHSPHTTALSHIIKFLSRTRRERNPGLASPSWTHLTRPESPPFGISRETITLHHHASSSPSRKVSKQPIKPQKQTSAGGQDNISNTTRPHSRPSYTRIPRTSTPSSSRPSSKSAEPSWSCEPLKDIRSTYPYKIRPAWAYLRSLGTRAKNQCPPSICRVLPSHP